MNVDAKKNRHNFLLLLRIPVSHDCPQPGIIPKPGAMSRRLSSCRVKSANDNYKSRTGQSSIPLIYARCSSWHLRRSETLGSEQLAVLSGLRMRQNEIICQCLCANIATGIGIKAATSLTPLSYLWSVSKALLLRSQLAVGAIFPFSALLWRVTYSKFVKLEFDPPSAMCQTYSIDYRRSKSSSRRQMEIAIIYHINYAR